MHKWKYQAQQEKDNPYEKLIPLLSKYTVEQYTSLSEQDKDVYLNNIIKEIRKINVFPIIYYNKQGIKKEIESVINKDDVCFVDDALYTQAKQGFLLLDFLFPNLHFAECFNISGNNVYTRFFDDEKLKFCLDKNFSSSTKSTNMRTIYFKYSRFYWASPSNFSPIRAKAIYERFCPAGGIIYDYSAGFGGRMLGALSSHKNFHYIGTDPNTVTYNNLLQLGQLIEEVTHRNKSYQIFNLESEKFELKKNSVDFAFSCPPFFKKEIYSDESTQSTNKFPQYEDWLENYVRPTIKNCYSALKDNGVYGVDIINYYYAGKKMTIVEDWLRIAQEEGFYFKKAYPILSKMRKKKEEDKECIYIFMKKDNINVPDYNTEEDRKQYVENINKNLESTNRRKNYSICEYDIFGTLEKIYKDYSELPLEYNIDEIKNAIKAKPSVYKNKYFRIFRGDDIVKMEIEVKIPVCEAEGNYFFSYEEAGKYLGVSRQAANQAKIRKSKKVNNIEVTWFN